MQTTKQYSMEEPKKEGKKRSIENVLSTWKWLKKTQEKNKARKNDTEMLQCLWVWEKGLDTESLCRRWLPNGSFWGHMGSSEHVRHVNWLTRLSFSYRSPSESLAYYQLFVIFLFFILRPSVRPHHFQMKL